MAAMIAACKLNHTFHADIVELPLAASSSKHKPAASAFLLSTFAPVAEEIASQLQLSESQRDMFCCLKRVECFC